MNNINNNNFNNPKYAPNSPLQQYPHLKSPNSRSTHSVTNEKSSRMFKSTEWRDLWAALLYYAHLIGVFVIVGINFPQLLKAYESFESESLTKVGEVVGVVAVMVVTSVILISIFLSLCKRFPTTIIKTTFIATIVLFFAMGIGLLFTPGGQMMGILNIIIAGLNVVMYFAWRKRFAFSGTLLKTVIDVLDKYPNTWNLSALAIFGQFGFIILYAVAIMSVGVKYSDKTGHSASPSGFDTFSALYIVFSMYWSMQVVENVVHTSVCGVYGTFYFLQGSGAAILKPVWSSLSRSLTYSFGSIAFGSLIIAVIQFVRFLINSTRNDRDNIAAACADCLIGIIEGLVRYFNYYAYVHVAIYGKPFIESAKDTWELIKSHGVDVIINDSLIGNCMGFAVFVISMICALGGFLLGMLFFKNNAIAISSAVASFVFSLMITSVATQIIESGASATLVCFAEDPAALQRTKPELYQEIIRSYQVGLF